MECDRTGSFRGEIISYGLWTPSGKKSTAISVTVRVTEWYDPGIKEWVDFRPYDMDVEGDIWIINKDGKLLEEKIKDVCEFLGWNGDIGVFDRHDWEPKPFGFSVEEDEYKNKIRYRLAFINAHDYTGGKTADPAALKLLSQQYGAQLRALAGSASKPKAPSTPPPKPATTTKLQTESLQPTTNAANRAAMQTELAKDDSQIPF